MSEPSRSWGLWERWVAAGYSAPVGATEPGGGYVSPFAPGIDVSVSEVTQAPVEFAAWRAQRAADPQVAALAARDPRAEVASAALANPRCPLPVVFDAVAADVRLALGWRVAARFNPDALHRLVCATGPRVAARDEFGKCWQVPFSDVQCCEQIAACEPGDRLRLLERVVWPTVAHWVLYGVQGPFDAAAVLDAAFDAVFADADVVVSTSRRSLLAALSSAVGTLWLIDGDVAQRLVSLQVPEGVPPLELGVLVRDSVPLSVEAVACFTVAGDVSLYRRVLSERLRLGRDALAGLVAAGVGDSERFALLVAELDAAPQLWPRLASADRATVAAALPALVASSSLGVLVATVLADSDVDVSLRADVFAESSATPVFAPSPAEAETWVHFTRRALGRQHPVPGELGRAAWALNSQLALAVADRELVWDLADALSAMGVAERPSVMLSKTLGATAPVPAERLVGWLGAFIDVVGPASEGSLGATVSPADAAALLGSLVAASPGCAPSSSAVSLHVLEVAVHFADVVDHDPSGAALLGSLPGLVPRLVNVAVTRPWLLEPLARRLTDAGVGVAGWRLVEELSLDWPGSLDALVATAAAGDGRPW